MVTEPTLINGDFLYHRQTVWITHCGRTLYNAFIFENSQRKVSFILINAPTSRILRYDLLIFFLVIRATRTKAAIG